MEEIEISVDDIAPVRNFHDEVEELKKNNKSIKWKEIIDEDLKEMERDLERIKLPRSVKSKIMTDYKNGSSENASVDDDEMAALDREIAELRQKARKPPKVYTSSSDEEDLKHSGDELKKSFRAEISVDDELRALDREIAELKRPKSLRSKDVPLPRKSEPEEGDHDLDKREQSPFRVSRPIAPNFKLLIDSDEDGDVDAALAKKFQEPPDKKPGDTYKCRFCGLTYNYMTTLKAHERVHDVEEPYVCSRCGMSFRYYAELQTHSVEHKGEKGYKCECGRTFTKYTDLLNHAHPGEDGEIEPHEFVGDEISAAKVPSYLKNYPAPRLSYYCQFCCKGYTTSHELKYHLYSHRGERQFGIGSSASRYLMERE